jgi:nickel/cobalt transporter (NicO) family protein
MSVSTRAVRLVTAFAVIIAILLCIGFAEVVFAQGSPFGVPGPPSAPEPMGGIVGWLLAKQAEFYRQFSGLIRASKADGSATLALFGLSFLYGIFHAAGPGHGKAVISSYMVANEETWVRGVVLSFASAMLQAVVAVAIVGIAAAVLDVGASAMNGAVNIIEWVSYGLIVLVGARLSWLKGRGLVAAIHQANRPVGEVGAAVARKSDFHDHAPKVSHQVEDCDRHHGGPHSHAHHDHDHGDDHAHHDHHGASCGHAHGPEPEELAGPGGWKRGLTAIVAVGLRPCSGAILVLVFALAQGLFWVGVGSTFMMGLGTFITVAAIATIAVAARGWASRIADSRPRYGTVAIRGMERAAALVVTAFGGLLLTGYIVNERMFPF